MKKVRKENHPIYNQQAEFYVMKSIVKTLFCKQKDKSHFI